MEHRKLAKNQLFVTLKKFYGLCGSQRTLRVKNGFRDIIETLMPNSIINICSWMADEKPHIEKDAYQAYLAVAEEQRLALIKTQKESLSKIDFQSLMMGFPLEDALSLKEKQKEF